VSVLGKAYSWVREIIGATPSFQYEVLRSMSKPYTLDWSRMDYAFYDKLRHGKAAGYTLGSLFCQRIENIFASWVFGGGVVVKTRKAHAYTDEKLAEFIDNVLDDGLIQVYEDSMGLGDQWIVMNADGTLSIPSPDTVVPEYDPIDYRKLAKVIITTKTKELVIEDEYTEISRIIRITTRVPGPTLDIMPRQQTQEFYYANLFGQIPIVHVPFRKGRNEVYGRSVHEQLLNLYSQYDDIIYKQMDGAKLLGNPIPAFTGLEDVSKVYDANRPSEEETYTDKDGNTVTRKQIQLDQNSLMLVGKGGDFKFVGAAVGFSDDTRNALKSLFLLLLDHTGIPEFLWGNELSSARASSETQLTQWIHDIGGRQHSCSLWLRELCTLYLTALKIIDRRVIVDELSVTWPPLTVPDQNMELKRIQFAKHNNLITAETSLRLLQLVDDPAAEAAAAEIEAQERAQALADTMGQEKDPTETGGQLSPNASPNQARNETTGE